MPLLCSYYCTKIRDFPGKTKFIFGGLLTCAILAPRQPHLRRACAPPLFQPVIDLLIDEREQMKRLVGPPVLQLDQLDIPVQLGLPEIILRLLGHVKTGNPSSRIGHFLEPFFIIVLIAAMKIKDVLRDEDELRNTGFEELIRHLPLQEHNVVLDRIIPFPEQLYHHIVLVIVSQQYLQVQSPGPEIIPLRMDIVVIDRLGKLEFRINPPIER